MAFAYDIQMLKTIKKRYHRVLRGQTLAEIATAYHVGEYALAKENGLEKEVQEGQVLRLPKERGNRYIVRAGDSKKLLCGSKENYEKRNGPHLYLGQRVVL